MNGRWGWIAVAVVVTVWDGFAVATGGESMSSAFRRSLQHPRRRWRTVAVVVYLLAHLFLPEPHRRFDPLCRLDTFGRRLRPLS